jgi:hypothetical protein
MLVIVPPTSHRKVTLVGPLVVTVPLKFTEFGWPHLLKFTDAFTVTVVTITAVTGMTGKLLKSPEVVETLADTQQNRFELFGS